MTVIDDDAGLSAGATLALSVTYAPVVIPGQINAQIPFELVPGDQYQVQVNASGALSTASSIQVVSVAPGVVAYGSGAVIAQHAADFSLVTEESPAHPGEYVVFYLFGLGATDNAVPTGAATPAKRRSHAFREPARGGQ